MEERRAAFVGLGSNEGDPPARLDAALARLDARGLLVAAVSRAFRNPFEEGGRAVPGEPAVLNAVAEVRFRGDVESLLATLHAVEDEEGRSREGRRRRLDLDLLSVEGVVRPSGAPRLPHPRALERAFVLAPWEEVAPLHEVPGTGRTVAAHAARLRAARPDAFAALEPALPPRPPPRAGPVEVLRDRRDLEGWRSRGGGSLGVVMTMGALHEGHASLVRRARAECARVLATVFVNPLQFGPGEDLDRYPRTPDADLALLGEAGADALYAPEASDLYGPGFATTVVPEGPARGFEGEARPGHFRGVATVVAKLWLRTRPDRAYFGWKDAQQVAVVRRVRRDLDLPGEAVACPTVREPDGLAMSSRNRYLSADERRRALSLPRSLDGLRLDVARGVAAADATASARHRMEAEGLRVEYVAVVDPDSMTPLDPSDRPALAVAVARAGSTRLLDNRWVVAAGADA